MSKESSSPLLSGVGTTDNVLLELTNLPASESITISHLNTLADTMHALLDDEKTTAACWAVVASFLNRDFPERSYLWSVGPNGKLCRDYLSDPKTREITASLAGLK